MKKPNLEGVKNLLFDLGGVIMDIRRENCIKALEQLEVSGIGEMLGVYCQQGAFLQLEEGKITPAEFRDYVRGKSARTLSDEEIDTAFDAFLVGIPVARLHALESLRNHYKIYVLSNTNAIMYNQGIRREFEKDGKHREDYFDGICTSFEEGVAKPDRRRPTSTQRRNWDSRRGLWLKVRNSWKRSGSNGYFFQQASPRQHAAVSGNDRDV